MEHRTTTLEAPDGTKRTVERWTPAGDVRFVVAISHGQGEHVGRYTRVAADLGEHGGVVFGLDHKGEGSSEGTRGYTESFEDYAADLRHVMLHVAEDLPPAEVPWFLFGHSMGGLIALTYLLDHEKDIPLRGAIFSAPLLGVAIKVNPLKLALGNIASVVMPKLALPSGIPVTAICRDPEEVKRYDADERRTQVVTAGWFAAMKAAIARVEAQVGNISLPCLWYVGDADTIADHEATQRVFASIDKAGQRDQTLRTFEGYYHELHNEPDEYRTPVIEMLTEWLEAHAGD